MVQQNCQEETSNSENPLWGGNDLWGAKISVENFKANPKVSNRQNQKMTLKPGQIIGLFKVTSFIVIAMNLEISSTCRKKKHSLFHWNTLMQQGLITLIWTSRKKIVLMIIGMWTRTEVYRNLRQDSRSSGWKEKTPKGHMWSGIGDIDDNSSNYQTWECVAWSMDQNWKSRSEERIARTGNREAKARQRAEVERHLLHCSGRWSIQRNHQKRAEKFEGSDGGGHALQERDKVLIEPASPNLKGRV